MDDGVVTDTLAFTTKDPLPPLIGAAVELYNSRMVLSTAPTFSLELLYGESEVKVPDVAAVEEF